MKVYISVDMEGVAGIATLDQVLRGGTGYGRAQQLMTAETNAAIAGAFDAGATEVIVNDSHGTMDNLLHTDVDERARLVFGAPKAQCMAQGLPPGCDVALFVGYHAGAGAPGVLAHTFSAYFTELSVNGEAVTEAEVNALYAASLGVPVGLLTGDSAICAVAEKAFPGVVTAAVKSPEGFTAAASMHPNRATARIREASERAVAQAGEIAPVAVPETMTVSVGLLSPAVAEYVAFAPGARRTGELTVERDVSDVAELLQLVNCWYALAAQGVRALAPLLVR
jgi:D-amino peptidase